MATLNIENTRKLLQNFEFNKLFIEELGWSNPQNRKAIPIQLKEAIFSLTPIAELSKALVYEVITNEGAIPDYKTRQALALEVQKMSFEHLLIFVNLDKSQSVWHWLKKTETSNTSGKKKTVKFVSREHTYFKGQPGDLFIAKMGGLVFEFSELENDVSIVEVASRLKQALDIERVTKKFYKDYQDLYIEFQKMIAGIIDERSRKWYASVLLNRLMFIYFLQKKGFVNDAQLDYLDKKLETYQKSGADEGKFYSEFLNALFFEGFAKPETEREPAVNQLLGKIVYLNGGLFIPHKIEINYPDIQIPDQAFANLFALFNRYSWNLNDTPGGKDDEINPDVLGYIFEKYINQKAFGAYYTRPEITEYLCEQTVYKLVLQAINQFQEGNAMFYKKPYRTFSHISELLLNLDAELCKKLLFDILPNLSLLDPACGSGAFLVSAMKTLINLYSAIIGKIKFLTDKKLNEWLTKIEAEHPSTQYFIKKSIITDNLYGVDIMEEAVEIAKLRLFLFLVASAQKVTELEPLPNIDFNLLAGNSLIGLMRVDDQRFKQLSLFTTKTYRETVDEKTRLIQLYKKAKSSAEASILRQSIDNQRNEAIETLNNILLSDFSLLKIKYEQATWDATKGKEGKPQPRALTKEDIKNLQPFHWSFEFDEIFRLKNGFDAIITNPPWEVFKPNGKEFLAEYSELVSKKKMNIKDFEKEQGVILRENPDIKVEWENYLSRFPHVSLYFRNSKQYENQISIVNGKKAGTDINLYKLFVEQCYNMLKNSGYCGIIIPSGIYTDLGAKQLRQLLLEKSQINELIGLSNEKFLFEGVDHRFKICLLSFEKNKKTDKFWATFRINPREAVGADNLDFFLHNRDNFMPISYEFIRKQSPDSLSVMEIRQNIDFVITDKILQFPSLGKKIENTWNLSLGAGFHMTNDSYLFHKERKNKYLPLYEGKMMNQFAHQQAEPNYWLSEVEARQAILGKKEDDGQLIDYQLFRLGLRAISSSTNTRTIISTILPKNVFCGNSLLVGGANMTEAEKLYLTALFNSLVVDYYARQIVSANINMFYIYQLPIPRLQENNKWFKEIAHRAGRLICSTEEFADLAEEVNSELDLYGESIEVKQLSEVERNRLRAELDAIVANLYGLSEEELVYILSTFPLVAEAQKVAVQNAFRDIQQGLLE
jgi:hypothetical protein